MRVTMFLALGLLMAAAGGSAADCPSCGPVADCPAFTAGANFMSCAGCARLAIHQETGEWVSRYEAAEAACADCPVPAGRYVATNVAHPLYVAPEGRYSVPKLPAPRVSADGREPFSPAANFMSTAGFARLHHYRTTGEWLPASAVDHLRFET